MAARAGERAGAPGVDEWLDAELEFPGGATGTARCHMAYDGLEMSIRLVGSRGEATAPNFVLPHLDDRVVVRTAGGERTEHTASSASSGTDAPSRTRAATASSWYVYDERVPRAGLEARPRTAV